MSTPPPDGATPSAAPARRPRLPLVASGLLLLAAAAQVVLRTLELAAFDWAEYAADAADGGAPVDPGTATAITAGTFALTILASAALGAAAVAVLLAAVRRAGLGPRWARLLAGVVVGLDVLGVYLTAQFPGIAIVVAEAVGVLLLWLPASRTWFGDRAPHRRDLGSPR